VTITLEQKPESNGASKEIPVSPVIGKGLIEPGDIFL
jgi:hypothetical protein